MYVLNESNELVASHVYAKELFSEGFGFETVTEEEAEEALATLYDTSMKAQLNTLFMGNDAEKTSLLANYETLSFNRKKLWATIKEYFCRFIKEDTTFKDILTQIIEAIASVIPGGKLIKALVKIIVKYLFGQGIQIICP